MRFVAAGTTNSHLVADMKTIIVNFTPVKLDPFTYARIEKFAIENGMAMPDAVSFLLEKVI